MLLILKNRLNKATLRVLALGTFVLLTTSLFHTPPPSQPAPSTSLSRRDQIHLLSLNAVCNTHKSHVISYTHSYSPPPFDNPFMRPTPHPQDDNENNTNLPPSGVYGSDNLTRLAEFLSHCPVIDVHMSDQDWNPGYCEDTMAYTKYLQTRLVPTWIYNTTFNINGTEKNYLEMCPHTAVLFMNHYWDGLPNRTDWPATKKVIVMPNVEMPEWREPFLLRADEIICKTRDCRDRHERWFEMYGNPRGARIWYTRHISSNLSLLADLEAERGGIPSLRPKDFSDDAYYMLHIQGKSPFKGTLPIIQCWKHRPNLPHLNLIGIWVRDRIEDELTLSTTQRNLAYAHTHIPLLDMAVALAEAPVQLCPSEMEGYGHGINQARAAGALVLAPDHAPMRELISPESGVLVRGVPVEGGEVDGRAQMMVSGSGAAYALEGMPGLRVKVPAEEVCRGVDVIRRMGTKERRRRAERGRAAYVEDALFFEARMAEIKAVLAKEQRARLDE
ncbi:hypothetical protein BC830DRAFT_1165055 [Chytriomyces sp. MP71]|nr:hypothetical protein BC830DRAFT_1165055 [Chytriomyces sp. MP71]